jgi:hypothetical protein
MSLNIAKVRQRKVRQRLLGYAWLTVIVLGLVFATYCICSLVVQPVEYKVCIKCEIMPENDAALIRWLHDQPGVWNELVGRHGHEVHITFIIYQNLVRTYPRAPDFNSALPRFGYKCEWQVEWRGSKLYFRE